MAKFKKIARLQGSPSPRARGRTAKITQQVETDPTKGAVALINRTEADRPQTPGGGKTRGDRRDMSRTYTNNERHAARGSNPRKDVQTRKR